MTLTNSESCQCKDERPRPWVRATCRSRFVATAFTASRFALAAICILGTAQSVIAQQTKAIDFSTVSQTVQRYFASLDGYEPGDLITQSQAKAALNRVDESGWKIPDKNGLIKLALADNSFLIKELSSPRGKSFMRKIAKYPGGYSRLDRLSTIARGHVVVRQLVDAKGGDEMIQYMATTKGGENLGRMMAHAQHGVDLNKRTGRIYTAEELLAVLKQAYDQ